MGGGHREQLGVPADHSRALCCACGSNPAGPPVRVLIWLCYGLVSHDIVVDMLWVPGNKAHVHTCISPGLRKCMQCSAASIGDVDKTTNSNSADAGQPLHLCTERSVHQSRLQGAPWHGCWAGARALSAQPASRQLTCARLTAWSASCAAQRCSDAWHMAWCKRAARGWNWMPVLQGLIGKAG